MDDVALANYIAGSHFGNVEAGRLDHLCAGLLDLEPGTEIWFSDYTMMKLRLRHGDINFSHYKYMPSVLLRGFIARGRKLGLLELWWVDHGSSAREPAAYFIVLKATKRGEVFVETFHRAHIKESRRLHRKAKREGRLIREQHSMAGYPHPEKAA
jgi:hypothetical protein